VRKTVVKKNQEGVRGFNLEKWTICVGQKKKGKSFHSPK
jgi:hypothetical protein